MAGNVERERSEGAVLLAARGIGRGVRGSEERSRNERGEEEVPAKYVGDFEKVRE